MAAQVATGRGATNLRPCWMRRTWQPAWPMWTSIRSGQDCRRHRSSSNVPPLWRVSVVINNLPARPIQQTHLAVYSRSSDTREMRCPKVFRFASMTILNSLIGQGAPYWIQTRIHSQRSATDIGKATGRSQSLALHDPAFREPLQGAGGHGQQARGGLPETGVSENAESRCSALVTHLKEAYRTKTNASVHAEAWLCLLLSAHP